MATKATNIDYPPSQVPGSLSVEKALQLLQTGSRGSGT